MVLIGPISGRGPFMIQSILPFNEFIVGKRLLRGRRLVDEPFTHGLSHITPPDPQHIHVWTTRTYIVFSKPKKHKETNITQTLFVAILRGVTVAKAGRTEGVNFR